MTGDFLPEYTFSPASQGGYWPAYRLFTGAKLKIVPGCAPMQSTVAATRAAMEYVRQKLNPPIRAEQQAVVADALGVDAFYEKRALETAKAEQDAFGTIFVRHRPVVVEKRRRFA